MQICRIIRIFAVCTYGINMFSHDVAHTMDDMAFLTEFHLYQDNGIVLLKGSFTMNSPGSDIRQFKVFGILPPVGLEYACETLLPLGYFIRHFHLPWSSALWTKWLEVLFLLLMQPLVSVTSNKSRTGNHSWPHRTQPKSSLKQTLINF